MNLFYALGVRGYSFLIRIASLWNPKAKKWMQGRKVVWDQLNKWNKQDTPVYWFHCASLGEFEQGRPVMERLKSEQDVQIVVTFFSPSGYEIRKNYEGADLIIYLPRENKSNVKRFLDIVRPEKVFFVKYEFWATYIFEAKKRGAAVYSISAVFRASHIFFKSYGGFMRKVLRAFDGIFVQDAKSKELLSTINIEATLAGDTRYDRVMQNAEKVKPYPEIEGFIADKKVLVVGSSWAEDDVVINDLINSDAFDWKVIIAPHEIGENRVKAVESGLKKTSVLYSELDSTTNADVLIIDNIGMLMNVYQYATLAYVGGAFGKGLHNILEPACFGVPVIFGNKYEKFVEAYDFIDGEIGLPVGNSTEFNRVFNELKEADYKSKVLTFMKDRIGATAIIVSAITGEQH